MPYPCARTVLPLAATATFLLSAAAAAQEAQGPQNPPVVDEAAMPARGPLGRSDLLGLYRDALLNDPTYAAARFAEQVAMESPHQARAALRPNVALDVGASENRYEVSPPVPRYGITYWAWGPTLTATLPLYRPQLNDALDQSQLTVKQAEAQLVQARQDLSLRVAQAYFDVLAARDTLEALEANQKATAGNLAQAKREFEVGTKTIVDTHEAQARADQIVAQEQVARGDLVVKQYALRAIIGHDPGTLLTLAEAPQLMAPVPSDPDAWAHNAEQSNPQVAQALASADIARIEVQRQKRGWGPTLDLQGQVAVARESGSTLVQPAGTSRTGLIGLQLVVPIYTGGLVQSQVRAALASEDQAQQNLEFARRTAGQSARQAYTGAVYGLEQIHALESARVSAQSQLDSTITGYKVGVRVNVEVLDAETQLFNTERDLKKARYDFLVNGLKLQSAVGELEERDLEAVNRMLVR